MSSIGLLLRVPELIVEHLGLLAVNQVNLFRMLGFFVVIRRIRVLNSVERVRVLFYHFRLIADFIGLPYYAVHCCVEDVFLALVECFRGLAFLELFRNLELLIGTAQMYAVKLLLQWCLLQMLGTAMET
jgi:hypothetical protein